MLFVPPLQSRHLPKPTKHGSNTRTSVQYLTPELHQAEEERERLTDTTETLGGLVSQHVDTFGDQTARVVDDRHACFEAQHDVRVCEETKLTVVDQKAAFGRGFFRLVGNVPQLRASFRVSIRQRVMQGVAVESWSSLLQMMLLSKL